ncbi:MAG TPA: type II toxin-antitoxin system VapC family toxin [Candidatus Thermoplasmatota archaeon]|nr:type II toxin-antitoxin system VapC family toxin [Candidatus Thermoplasmatota archaeon]
MGAPGDPIDFVVDASALAKLFLEEIESEAFRAWYVAEVQRGSTFGAPALLGYEMAHLLASNIEAPGAKREAAKWWARRLDEILDGIDLDDNAARHVFPWMPHLSGYDASYLAVATLHKASIVSYDRRMLTEAERQGLRTITP